MAQSLNKNRDKKVETQFFLKKIAVDKNKSIIFANKYNKNESYHDPSPSAFSYLPSGEVQMISILNKTEHINKNPSEGKQTGFCFITEFPLRRNERQKNGKN